MRALLQPGSRGNLPADPRGPVIVPVTLPPGVPTGCARIIDPFRVRWISLSPRCPPPPSGRRSCRFSALARRRWCAARRSFQSGSGRATRQRERDRAAPHQDAPGLRTGRWQLPGKMSSPHAAQGHAGSPRGLIWMARRMSNGYLSSRLPARAQFLGVCPSLFAMAFSGPSARPLRPPVVEEFVLGLCPRPGAMGSGASECC